MGVPMSSLQAAQDAARYLRRYGFFQGNAYGPVLSGRRWFGLREGRPSACLVGAIEAVTTEKARTRHSRMVAGMIRDILEYDLANKVAPVRHHRPWWEARSDLVNWNDADGRTPFEVIRLLETVYQ